MNSHFNIYGLDIATLINNNYDRAGITSDARLGGSRKSAI